MHKTDIPSAVPLSNPVLHGRRLPPFFKRPPAVQGVDLPCRHHFLQSSILGAWHSYHCLSLDLLLRSLGHCCAEMAMACALSNYVNFQSNDHPSTEYSVSLYTYKSP